MLSSEILSSQSISVVSQFSGLPPPDTVALRKITDVDNLRKSYVGEHWIVVGGEVFSRGITLPNLLVSLFGRVSVSQEQLLQFCRWFGHRQPEFTDLTTVMCQQVQKDQFRDLWSVVSRNYQALLAEYSAIKKGDRLLAPDQIKLIEIAGTMILANRNPTARRRRSIEPQPNLAKVCFL